VLYLKGENAAIPLGYQTLVLIMGCQGGQYAIAIHKQISPDDPIAEDAKRYLQQGAIVAIRKPKANYGGLEGILEGIVYIRENRIYMYDLVKIPLENNIDFLPPPLPGMSKQK